MKISNNSETTFKAFKTASNAKIFMSKNMFSNDYKFLTEVSDKLAKTKFWDFEITAAGYKIASRNTKDAFVSNFAIKKVEDSKMIVESTYDGYAKNVSKGKPCHFVLDYSNEEEAINAYSNMRNGTFLHKAIMILEKLEEQSAALFNKNKNVDPESTIVIDTWLDKVLRFLFEQY